jgi:hypothetical protein
MLPRSMICLVTARACVCPLYLQGRDQADLTTWTGHRRVAYIAQCAGMCIRKDLQAEAQERLRVAVREGLDADRHVRMSTCLVCFSRDQLEIIQAYSGVPKSPDSEGHRFSVLSEVERAAVLTPPSRSISLLSLRFTAYYSINTLQNILHTCLLLVECSSVLALFQPPLARARHHALSSAPTRTGNCRNSPLLFEMNLRLNSNLTSKM